MSKRGNAEITESEGGKVCVCVCVGGGFQLFRWAVDEKRKKKERRKWEIVSDGDKERAQ